MTIIQWNSRGTNLLTGAVACGLVVVGLTVVTTGVDVIVVEVGIETPNREPSSLVCTLLKI